MRTAAQLGVTPEEHRALREVRTLLLSGRVVLRMSQPYVSTPPAGRPCGCVGAWVGESLGDESYMGVGRRPAWRPNALTYLYYPRHPRGWRAQAEDGARAVERFLDGDPDPWSPEPAPPVLD